MNCPPEHFLLFYAALQEHDPSILSRAGDILDLGIDADYLDFAAEAYGVAAGMVALLRAMSRTKISEALLAAAEREASTTRSMFALYAEIAALLDGAGIPFIPLKGCDRRIAIARRHSNSMRDVDILVHSEHLATTGKVLARNGYLHIGALSGAHVNYATDEEIPRFIEIHWDLVNRSNPIQRRLFSPDLGNIWKRSMILCGRLHLSPEDFVCYTAEHAAKEFFRQPKWLADLAWIRSDILPGIDAVRLKSAVGEWGVSAVLGIVETALDSVLPDRGGSELYGMGARRPGILGRFVAERLLWYSRISKLKPLCSLAFSHSPGVALGVTAGIGERVIRGRKFGRRGVGE